MTRLLPVLLLLAACPKTTEPDASVEAGERAAMPRLPNPRAGTYARVPAKPDDLVVRRLVADRIWDASLAGAAAGLALNAAERSGGFTRREVREAAWQAGYPWPILALGTWPTSEAGAPPSAVSEWLANQPSDRDVGVVRARGDGKDLWVALAGKAQISLGVIPREMPAGTPLRLPAHPGATWRVSDGSGAFRQGSLDAGVDLNLDVPGEWIIHIVDAGGDLARFPIYVDEEPAPLPVLPPHNVTIASKKAAQDRVIWLLQRARDEYRNGAFVVSPLLAQAAEDALSRELDPEVRADQLAVRPDRGVGATCRASSVEDCVDQMLWDPRTRIVFVDDAEWSAGVALKWTSQVVQINAVFAGE